MEKSYYSYPIIIQDFKRVLICNTIMKEVQTSSHNVTVS